MTFQTMCALRIYLRRGDNALGEKSFWRRLFKRPLHAYLLEQSLKAGVTHAALSLGHMGFAKGAAGISAETTDIPVSSMPVCVELVGPKPLLEQFVRDHARQIADATLVMLEGVHVRPQIVEENLAPAAAHHVEYVNVDGVRLPVDHIDVTEQTPKQKTSSRP